VESRLGSRGWGVEAGESRLGSRGWGVEAGVEAGVRGRGVGAAWVSVWISVARLLRQPGRVITPPM
jgi:hypothetical protein